MALRMSDLGLRIVADWRLRIADWTIAAFLVTALGCRTTSAPPPPPAISWQTDLALALDDARKSGKPILVVAVIGDIDHQC